MKRKLKQQVSKCAKCIKIGCVLKNQCMLHFRLHFLTDILKLELLSFARKKRELDTFLGEKCSGMVRGKTSLGQPRKRDIGGFRGGKGAMPPPPPKMPKVAP